MPASAGPNHSTPPSRSSGRTVLVIARRILLLIVITYLMLLTPLAYLQRSLIYHPSRCAPLLAGQIGFPQATFDLTVKSFDGLELHGWIALAGTSSHSEPIDLQKVLTNGRPVVLIFPGNAGDRSDRFNKIAVLASLNAHVVLVDYRGYADNEGRPSEQNFARDARSIWNHLTRELGVPAHRIVLYGESLGGGSATRLASSLCQEGIEPGGLIAQSTFSSLVAAAQYHFPIVPVSLILVDRFRSDLQIPQVTCPILQIHGALDSIVPFQIGQKLFEAAPATSSAGIAKRQIVLPHADHNDVYDNQDFELLRDGLNQFLESVARAPNPDPQKSQSATQPMPTSGTVNGPIGISGWTIIPTLAILFVALFIWWLFRRLVR